MRNCAGVKYPGTSQCSSLAAGHGAPSSTATTATTTTTTVATALLQLLLLLLLPYVGARFGTFFACPP
eukprot:1621680-Prymnesium_polylepis.1